ncbi:MAG TPA: sigma-70 family RNA polymerase sigma factor [Gemmatimonadaceae bacterium]|nr:sigma-70 family RNA polymerase sigma factor [Gemmatimonadaceae bacterium]
MASPDGGPFEARYLAFLETVAHLRPSLHRYCARMTGSVTDGEDVVQEALFDAYRRLGTFDDARPLKPWLFRIAHHRCVDFLRRRGVREDAESEAIAPDWVDPDDPPGPALGRAVEQLVLALPPKERACVLLKDVLGHSLEETAELVDSTVGGVKAALHRGRVKLAALREGPPAPPAAARPEVAALLERYVERFNRRDWDGVRELVAVDARVRVADRYAGPLAGAPYFGRYARLTTPWRLVLAEVDGEPAAITEYAVAGVWGARGIVRLDVRGGRIAAIADYEHCPWMLPAADVRVR